jgi:hypothetical protein
MATKSSLLSRSVSSCSFFLSFFFFSFASLVCGGVFVILVAVGSDLVVVTDIVV